MIATGLPSLLFRLGAAVLVFLFVILWPVPQILLHFLLDVPMQILWIVGFLLGVATFIRGPIWLTGKL